MAEEKKEIWVKADVADTWEERKSRVTAALESGVDVVLVDAEDCARVKELGRIAVAAFVRSIPSDFMQVERTAEMIEEAKDADILVFGKDGEGDGKKPLPESIESSEIYSALKQVSGKKKAVYVEMLGKAYENFALNLAEYCDYIIIIGKDWKIIPLENIIASLHDKADVKVIAGVKTVEEARTALETLEHGADGVLMDTDDPSEMKKAVELRESLKLGKISLTTAKVTKVKPLEMGDRVCVDTCSLMRVGEGMLVGSQSFALFLVHSETEESPYVEARPFRVNAGAVHAYILVGEKTKYLAELRAGDEVLIVDVNGNARKSVVGRAKIERRPLILVEAEVDVNGEKRKCSVILQNAETIKLVRKDKKPISVVSLKEGDEVLVHLTAAGRHFGIAVEETVIEK